MINNKIHINKTIEDLVCQNQALIDSVSKKLNLDEKIVEKQFRLHILQYELDNIDFVELALIIEKRLANYSFDLRNFKEKAKTNLIPSQSKIKNNKIVNKGIELNFKFKEVDIKTAEYIESKLHYLFAFREDAFKRYGLFVEDAEYPFCYMSFATITRYYRQYCINQFTNEDNKSNVIINLARVYGFGELPKNSISKLLAYCTKKLKLENIKYLTTSVNPYLGFNGKSMTASNFISIANCPVTYNYINGFYTTRRQSKNRNFNNQKTAAPPNILLLKRLDCSKKNELLKSKKVMDIDDKLYKKENVNLDISINKEKTVSEVRNDLEKVWSKITRYHRTNFDDSADPNSKGQCGVTTAYLAKELSDEGLDTLFCEGDVQFPGNTPPIENHCWIKIKEYKIGKNTLKNLIIDLTSDQSGFDEPVICSPNENLESRNIIYQEKKAYTPNKINNKSLEWRLQKLEQKLKALK